MSIASIGRLATVVGFGIVIGWGAVPAFAQEDTPDTPATAAEDEDGGVERQVVVGEIVVTAQKRAENVQDVPVSISTLSGEDLATITGGTPDIRALSGRVPSLIMESSFGRSFPRFYIRGLGNPDFDLNSSQPVSMVVDEVVLENPIVKGMPLFDLERIEVLRGPQGTLFGRNTPAGVVKFETRKPTQEFDARIRTSYGSFDSFNLEGAVGGALTDTLSARASVLYQSESDWIDNKYAAGAERKIGGFETTAYRLQLMWQPNDQFTGLLNIHGWDVDGTARVFRANILKPGGGGLVSDFDQDVVYHDGRNKQEISSLGGVLRFDYDFGAATLTSITGFESIDDMYSRGDIDGGYGTSFLGPGNYGPGEIAFASESADGLPYLDQWTQEFRIASNAGDPLNWLVGAFYFDEDLQVDSFSYDSLAGGADDGYSYQKQQAKAYALFGSVDYAFTDQWSLKAGVRFSHEEKDFVAQRLQPLFINNLLFGTLPSVPIYENVDDDAVSWDLSTLYKVNSQVNVYGRIATSFRAPSIQGRILFCTDIDGTDPETNCVTVADTEDILSVEAGIKTILADQRLRLNLSTYWYEIDGQQLTAVGGITNTARLLNADKTEGYGFESDIEFTPTGNWLMTFGFSYNPTEIKDPNLRVAACGGGCTITDPIDERGVIVDGNSLPHAPDVIFNGIVNFRSDPVNKGMFGTLDWAYYSEKNFFLYESKEFKDDSFELGLRVGYAWNQAKYEVAVFGRNILDEEVVRGGIDFNNLTGFTNDPRIIGLEFVGRF
jgi:iron complex outermembrane receptor protein